MQARYYDPVIGRFYSNDPVGFTGNPHSFNRYAYVNNNPYKYVDPDGKLAFLAWFATPPGIAALEYTASALVGTIAGVAIAENVLSDGEGATPEELDNSSNPDDPTAGKPVTTKEREKILKETKEKNDGKNKCWRCGYESEDDSEFDIGHANTPRSKGGTKHPDNLKCEGRACNRSAGNRGKPKEGSSCAEKAGGCSGGS